MASTPSSSPYSIKTDVESPPVRKSRRKFDFPIETLQEYAHYRQDDAARLLGVAPITLKRNCQRLRYRWPYRSIKAKLRREAISAQKQTLVPRLSSRSPTLAVPELLLTLGKGGTCLTTPLTPRARSFTTQVLAADEAMRPKIQPQLPPLKLLLQKHRELSPVYPPPRSYQPMTYKSVHFSTSFHSTAPKLPLRNKTNFHPRMVPFVDYSTLY